MSVSSSLPSKAEPETRERKEEDENVQHSPDVDLPVGGGDHLHLRDLAVDDLGGDVELVDHAERDGSTAGL